MSWVSTTKKSEFLKWFLNHHQLKNKDAKRVIDFILNHHHILSNLSFTENIQQKERTIIISSINSDKTGFLFYENNNKTEDVSEALWSFMMNPARKTYIIIDFFGKEANFRYTELIETSRLETIKLYEQTEKDAKATNLVVEISLLKNQINKALDDRDEELFKSLVRKLKELQQS